jgi:hypothetical protein
MYVTIRDDDLQQAIRALRRAGRESKRLLEQRLARAAEPLKDAVVESALRYGYDKAAAATEVRTERGRVTVTVVDAEARYARFSRKGVDRHPVFARPDQTREQWTWVNQPIGPFWQQGLDVGVERADREVRKVLDDLSEILEGRRG